MKLICAILIAIGGITVVASSGLKCTIPQADKIPTKWIDMVDPCINILQAQVKIEIDAAMAYLAMGAHFAKDTVNRPGFSEYFFNSAREEREHAIKIIEYLLMRGQLTMDVSQLLKFPLEVTRQEWTNAEAALKDALKLETQVTRKIRDIIQTCESPSTVPNVNDYHLVDYLTADFLGEQLTGQRELAGRISTLGKMISQNTHLGEFLYDKELLKSAV